jgi:2-haloacid dehalogenase
MNKKTNMINFKKFNYLTFDCYGTLIDWESGILDALKPVFQNHGIKIEDDEILELYAELEAWQEQGPYRTYREVLRAVMKDFTARLEFTPRRHEWSALEDSVVRWPPFPDSSAALRALSSRYKLVIISNIDDDLIGGSVKQLGVRFHHIITAQQARSYKPSLNNFQLAMGRLGTFGGDMLHVAQSLYHDIAPAKKLGIPTVWINRRKNKPGFGATPHAEAVPDLEVPDLASLAELAL